jgi:putative phosphoesterase
VKKVVVFADSHSGLSFMRRAISVLKPNAMIHLGDFYDDGAAVAEENPHILNYIVRGNCDWMSCFAEPELLFMPVFGVKLLMTHGHKFGVKQGTQALEAEGRARGADAVLYGHTHRPDCRCEEGLWILNPGTCAHYGGNVALITIDEGKIQECRIISSEDLIVR